MAEANKAIVQHAKVEKVPYRSVRRKIVLYGLACIQKDAKVDYVVYDVNGKAQNTKGGTIENLYNRFKSIPVNGKGYYQRQETKESTFSIKSFLPNGLIVTSKIEDVIYSGMKEVFEVVTELGNTVKATADHSFFRPDGTYTTLDSLVVGDYITVRGRRKVESRVTRKNKELLVKYHKNAPRKVVNGCLYYRVVEYRFLFEATMNGFSFDEYRTILNTEKKEVIDSLYSIPVDFEIHHIDGDHTNNTIENLQLLTREAHRKLHDKLSSSRTNNWWMLPAKIISITSKGQDHVYDITCSEDTPNFIANGIGVHNCSGKSSAIATLFGLLESRPTQRVVYVVTDRNAISGLEWGLQHYNVQLKEGQLYTSIIERKKVGNKKSFGNEVDALTKFQKQSSSAAQSNDASNMGKDKYNYYIDVLNGMNNFKGIDYVTGEEVVLGDVGDLTEEDILVIDGLTPITVSLWELIKGDRIIPTIADYGTIQSRLNTLTYNLMQLPCSVILLAHADRIKDDVENIEKMRIALSAGVALASSYCSSWDDVIYAYSDATGKYWAGKKMGVEVACRNYPEQDKLPPRFDLYNFFKKDGIGTDGKGLEKYQVVKK